jgi:hypothetical protein
MTKTQNKTVQIHENKALKKQNKTRNYMVGKGNIKSTERGAKTWIS